MKSIAQTLSTARKSKGYTQEELAEYAKVNLRTIQRIESAATEPRAKTLELICAALEISPKELIEKPKDDGVKEKRRLLSKRLVEGVFLIILNLIWMAILGFLTLDSEANTNSALGAQLLAVFAPLCVVFWTKNMDKLERLFKFGSGCLLYFILVIVIQDFALGFTTGLFSCLLICVSVLYHGENLIKQVEK
ncbi:MAG: helix-turn-helix transcriptional regulator [Bacteroidota bacterium]